MDYKTVVNAIDKPDGKSVVVKKYQDTKDIIADLIYCFKTYNTQAQPVVDIVKTGNIKTDAKNIYDFIRKDIRYHAEKDGAQTTRSFNRIINDKWGDCKHSALIVSSIGWNEGYNVIFRFVSYVPNETYGHVYTLLEDTKTGERVIVDPLQDFNFEKKFIKHKDFKAYQNPKDEHMALSRLTGMEGEVSRRMPRRLEGETTQEYARRVTHLRKIENEMRAKHHGKHPVKHHNRGGQHVELARRPGAMHEGHPNYETRHVSVTGMGDEITGDGCDHVVCNGVELFMQPMLPDQHLNEIAGLDGIGRRTKKQRQQARHARKEKRKARGGLFKTIALAPVRAAFTGLILLNFKGFATRMSEAAKKDEGSVKAFAKKFGYKYNTFISQVHRGAKKKSLGEITGYVKAESEEGIGFVVTATAVAAAAPAIVIAVQLFKKLGLVKPGDTGVLATAVNDASALTTGSPMPGSGGADGSGGGGGGGRSPESGGGGGMFPGESGGEGGQDGHGAKKELPGEEGEIAKEFLGLPKPVLIIGGIGLLVVAGKVFKLF